MCVRRPSAMVSGGGGVGVGEESPRRGVLARGLAALLLLLLYFTLSIGLTFYQRWLLRGVHFPLCIVMYHLVVKFCLASLTRLGHRCWYGSARVTIPLSVSARQISPTGLASGIDIGFSNWALELVTVSLYTMTKSTTIIFILLFAIALGLEKRSPSLVAIVVTISAGLAMFTYKATQFDPLGFALLLLASLASGLRWTFAQLLMQKSKLGLNDPVDLVYYVQPWMLVSVAPFAVYFEGTALAEKLSRFDGATFAPHFVQITFGALLAFFMELSEYLVVTYTSSLTLSVAGIFKEVIALVLAVRLTGDVLSTVNVLGLCACMTGICGHIAHKWWHHTAATVIEHQPRFLDVNLKFRHGVKKRKVDGDEHFVPLLMANGDGEATGDGEGSDPRQVLYDVLQRRDCAR